MNPNTEHLSKKEISLAMLCVGVGLLLGAGGQWVNLETISKPLLSLGGAMRTLGGSGWLGNVVLWICVLGVTLAPVGYALLRQNKGRGVDALLVLLSIQLFAFCYLIINPSYIPQQSDLPTQGAYISLTVWAMVATLGSYLLLRFAVSMQGLSVAQAASWLPRLLRVSAYFVLFLSAANASQGLATVVAPNFAFGSAGTTATPLNGEALMVAVLLSLLGLGVLLLSGVTLLWAGEVAAALLQSPYAQETVALCQCRAKGCITVLVCEVLVGVVCNLLQLLFFASLQDVSIQWSIPLLPLLLAGALFLLCHYVAGARALAEDNESII